MSLEPLATLADFEARLGRTLTSPDDERVEALLADTSAAVRASTGQIFTADTGVARLRPDGLRVRLPQRPVTAVNSVEDVDGNAIGFTWYSGDLLILAAAPTVAWVDVDYDHGYDEIPGDIVGVVCNVAARAFGTPADQGGYQSETIMSYSYAIGAAAAAGPAGMLTDERAILDRYRRVYGMARIGQ
jgi:hypothetical protein